MKCPIARIKIEFGLQHILDIIEECNNILAPPDYYTWLYNEKHRLLTIYTEEGRNDTR